MFSDSKLIWREKEQMFLTNHFKTLKGCEIYVIPLCNKSITGRALLWVGKIEHNTNVNVRLQGAGKELPRFVLLGARYALEITVSLSIVSFPNLTETWPVQHNHKTATIHVNLWLKSLSHFTMYKTFFYTCTIYPKPEKNMFVTSYSLWKIWKLKLSFKNYPKLPWCRHSFGVIT